MNKKFRAYDVQKKFYGKVDLIMWLSDDHIEVDYGGHNGSPRRVRPEEVVVEEWIGRKDVTGNEIFENDIVLDSFHRIMLVEYSDHFSRFQFKFLRWSDEKENKEAQNNFITADLFSWFIDIGKRELPKIIGSATSNPELLKQD